jgi:hypothetical protein
VSESFSSSSFVLGRFSGGTSETPAACFLYASFFHPSKPPRSPTDEDEGRRRHLLQIPKLQSPCGAIKHPKLVYRFLNSLSFAAGQLAVFQGASEVPLSGS